jgi:hypothetical protein
MQLISIWNQFELTKKWSDNLWYNLEIITEILCFYSTFWCDLFIFDGSSMPSVALLSSSRHGRIRPRKIKAD